jgi:hypothetical protein
MSSWFKSKFTTIREWYTSQDTQQTITVITSFASDAFKVVMASLLCVFVPQACSTEETNQSIFNSAFSDSSIAHYSNNINGTQITTHVCTFNENFSNLIDYNAFVLAFNFLTLGYFSYLYVIELRREKWMINHLDYDKEKPDDNILTLKISHPKIIDQLKIYNGRYKQTYKYLHIIYIGNFIFSAVLVLYYYYLDYRTITTLITNTILVSNKIRIGRQIAIQSADKDFAYSFYNNKNISFNIIDPRLDKPTDEEISIGGGIGSNVNMVETDIDGEYDSRIGNTQRQKENLQKQILNIKKYISLF